MLHSKNGTGERMISERSHIGVRHIMMNNMLNIFKITQSFSLQITLVITDHDGGWEGGERMVSIIVDNRVREYTPST